MRSLEFDQIFENINTNHRLKGSVRHMESFASTSTPSSLKLDKLKASQKTLGFQVDYLVGG